MRSCTKIVSTRPQSRQVWAGCSPLTAAAQRPRLHSTRSRHGEVVVKNSVGVRPHGESEACTCVASYLKRPYVAAVPLSAARRHRRRRICRPPAVKYQRATRKGASRGLCVIRKRDEEPPAGVIFVAYHLFEAAHEAVFVLDNLQRNCGVRKQAAVALTATARMSCRGRHSVQKGFAAAKTLSYTISNNVTAHSRRWNIKTRCTCRNKWRALVKNVNVADEKRFRPLWRVV